MLTLIHSPQSRSTRILGLLEELGAPYEIQYVTIARMNGSSGPDPANPHPDKKVPALVHNGEVITESAAIVLYLTDLFPEAGLGVAPGEPGRGTYVSWLSYYAGVIEPVVTAAFAGLGDHPVLVSTFRDREAMDRRILDALAKGPYLLGESYTGVDLLIASMGHWARQMLPAGELVDAYLERCHNRPALLRALEKDSPPQ